MRVILSPKAEKQFKNLPKVNQIILARKIRSLKDGSPLITNLEILKGYKGIYRLRVGDYRLVFKQTRREIYIIAIGHRKDIYDLLHRLLR